MAGITDDRRRLSDLMEQRRLELGLRWKQVAEAGGISYESIRAIRSGTADMRSLTRHGIETGLRWEAGSVERILAGGDPAPLAEPAPVIPPDSSGVYAEVDEVAAMVFVPLIKVRLAEQRSDRPSGEAMFLEDGDPLGAGPEVAEGLARAWSLAMDRGLDLDRAVLYAARAWALAAAYRARQTARITGQNGALVRRGKAQIPESWSRSGINW